MVTYTVQQYKHTAHTQFCGSGRASPLPATAVLHDSSRTLMETTSLITEHTVGQFTQGETDEAWNFQFSIQGRPAELLPTEPKIPAP